MTENNFKIDSASVSDRGLSKKRPNNEDSYLELNLKGLFAVADGVGGAQAGDVASQMAMEILGEAFNNLKSNEDAEEMMKVAIERANSAIYQMSQDLPQLSTMATTIVALHLSGNIGTIGHVGDSRLYRLDEKGNLYRETLDHSVVEEEVRAGRMTVAQAANHPSRNIISRALGADNTVEVDMKTIMFEPNTTFLLCSDGITRHIDDFELRELLVSSDTPSQICRKMKEICYERGAEDNLTAVIAKVSSHVAENGQSQNRFDYEEATVATARSPVQSASEPPNILELDDEIPTKPLTMPVAENLPPIELDVEHLPQTSQPEEPAAVNEPVYEYQEEVSYTEPEETAVEPEVEEPQFEETEIYEQPVEAAPQPSPPTVRELENKPYQEIAEVEENPGLSKLLVGVFTFLIGMIIGAGAIYIFMQNTAAPAEVPNLPPQTEDVSMTSFENLRRSVDDNPAEYITKYSANPGDAADYFLLGRAFMLTGNFAEAKKALGEAKNRLAEADLNNADVLANDISAYLAIIENPDAQKMFSDEVKKANVETESQTDVPAENANAGGNNQ